MNIILFFYFYISCYYYYISVFPNFMIGSQSVTFPCLAMYATDKSPSESYKDSTSRRTGHKSKYSKM